MSARELVLSCFLAVFQPRSDLPLRDWMAQNIVISTTENPSKPGSYDPDYTPLVPVLLDMLFTNPEWRELHAMKSSQSAFSFHTMGHVVRKVDESPGNTMYVIDSDKEARNISDRLKGLLEASPATSDIPAVDEDELNTLLYKLPGMNLWLTGAGSVGSLANKTATLGISDETDKHKDHKTEANTVDLLRARLKEQRDSKLINYSTPTTTAGQIFKEYETGTQHKAYVPCPHCDHEQVLTWERVKFGHCKDLTGEWDLERVLRETYYECESCKEPIHDHHKRGMFQRAIEGGNCWRPTNFKTVTGEDGEDQKVPGWYPGRMSAHYSDLYSQNENVSFGQLALKWIEALKDPKKMRNFLQNHLGLPDKESAAEVTEDKILALRGAYRRQRPPLPENLALADGESQSYDIGTPIPINPLFCAALVDTQDDNSKLTIQAFGRNGDQYVLDWGACIELFELDSLYERTVSWAVRGEDGEFESGEMPVSVMMIDEGGHRSFEVRQYAYDRYPSALTSRGSFGTINGASIGIRDNNRIRKDDPHAPTIPVIAYDDNTFKRELYIRRIARFDPEKAAAYGQSRTWLPSNLETEFTRELMKEKLEKQRDGSLKWNKPKGNDYADTLKMGLILWSYLGPELLKAEEMERRAAEGEA